jgi:LPXTG-motif cell wall-anchored protein
VPIEAHLPAGTVFTAVSGGYGHSVALTSTGQVYAWGQNDDGQLGDGSFTESTEPVRVHLPEGSTVTAIASGQDFVLALTSTGTVLSWGLNEWGQLGNGTTGLDSDVPVEVHLPEGTTVTAISAGAGHALALTSAGEVLAWGDNDFGQVGDGTTVNRDVPVPVAGLPADAPVKAIAGGDDHSLALTSTGAVYGWGYNGQGQLGHGTTTSSYRTPVDTLIPAGDTVVGLAAGLGFQSFAITSTGSLLAWGDNTYGQLGDGSSTRRTAPVPVHLPAGTEITAVASGDDHALALTSTGEIYAWGYNRYGQIGDGTTTNRNLPTQVDLPAGSVAVAVGRGNYHSLAVVQGPSSTTTLSAHPEQVTVGEEVGLTAEVACSAGAAEGEVRFVGGDGRVIGTAQLEDGVARISVSDLTQGTHTIVAEYLGGGACPASSSEAVTVTVAGVPETGSPTATEQPTQTPGPGHTGEPTGTPKPTPSPHETRPGGQLPSTGTSGIAGALAVATSALAVGAGFLLLRRRLR